MKIGRSLRLSAVTLLRHRLRTSLALGGLVIGVAVVLLMVGIGEGAKRQVLSQIERLGTDVLLVTAGESRSVPGRSLQAGTVTTLRLSDCAAIAAADVAGVADVADVAGAADVAAAADASIKCCAPGLSAARRAKFGALSTATTIQGTTGAYREIRNASLVAGEYFSDADNTAARRVAILGATVVREIFDGMEPLGAQILIGKIPFRVIGLLTPKGASADGNGDEDNRILIPIKTAMRRVFNTDHISSVFVKAASTAALPGVEARIRKLLRDRHSLDYLDRPDDFQIQDQDLALRAKSQAAGSFTAMIIGLAGISLFVGGIGILSIMLITVRERVGEIGLRLAVGAQPRDIVQQFLCESLVLGCLGGSAGLALGLTAVSVVNACTEWSAYVPAQWSQAAIAASVILGLGAGVYPASRAARMSPIDALRAD